MRAPSGLIGGRYAIDRFLGKGGMSTVYAARDGHVGDRMVAVKEMVDTFADPQERLEAERDFAREADMLATLHHPAIPTIIDRFSENNRHMLVMEYIEGETLEHMLKVHGAYPEDQVRIWALELCQVLGYLHSQHPPVVFRDLKPGNIIVQSDGRVRLVDFGIARLFNPQQKADTIALGTSGYASPEHYTGQTDARSDIYSLGATLHHLLTGRDPSKFPPFQFPPIHDLSPGVSPEFAALVERAVGTERDNRFATADEMRTTLTHKRRRRGRGHGHGGGGAPPPARAPGTPSLSLPVRAAPPAASGAPGSFPPSFPPPAPVVPGPQALVLAAASPMRRLDLRAIAVQIAALTGEDAGVLSARFQEGFPVVLPVPTGRGVAGTVQGLDQLGVHARLVSPRVVPVLLSGDLRGRLDTTHQLVVRDLTVGQARTCHCRRCGCTWRTNRPVGSPVPLRCPRCHSMDWGRWRIFKCAWCEHEWETADVHTRRPTRLFPTCPCCGLGHWGVAHPSSRSGLLGRLLGAFA